MAGEWNRQEALAEFFMKYRQERGQLVPGRRVVVFVMNGNIAEIRAQGIFFGFRYVGKEECIILGTIPDDEDEDTFPERLEHIARMENRGFILPPTMRERREQEPERRDIPLETGYLFADGEAYAQLNAITNIPREKPQSGD